MHEMDECYLWDFGIWECAGDSPRALLDHPNPSFNVADMFIGSWDVQIEHWDMVT
jgi:hypothetical protein